MQADEDGGAAVDLRAAWAVEDGSGVDSGHRRRRGAGGGGEQRKGDGGAELVRRRERGVGHGHGEGAEGHGGGDGEEREGDCTRSQCGWEERKGKETEEEDARDGEAAENVTECDFR